MKISQSLKVCSAILGAALFAGFGFVTHVSAQERYFLVDLNSKTVTGLSNLFGAKSTFPRGINDVGQVVGWSFDGVGYAFITGPGGVGARDLGALGEPYDTSAEDINDSGQVVGWSEMAEGASHAFITGPDGVGMRDLGALGGYSMAQAVNDAGQVAGVSGTNEGDRAFITGPDGMGMRGLGTLGGRYSSARDINNSGQVAGTYFTPGEGNLHAFITGPDGMDMRDLGTLGGGNNLSVAHGINDAGQVVGVSSHRVGADRAFITGPDGMGMRSLGTLGGEESFAWDINDEGEVVGTSATQTGGRHAFVTGPDGKGMLDLNSLVDLPNGVILTQATDINNTGQVIAVGEIPEPEIYSLLLGGLALIGFIARRKQSEDQV